MMNELDDNQLTLVRELVGGVAVENLIATNKEQKHTIDQLVSVSLVLFNPRTSHDFVLLSEEFGNGNLNVHSIHNHLMFVVLFDYDEKEYPVKFDRLLSLQIKLGWLPVASLKEAAHLGLFVSKQHETFSNESDDDDLLLLNVIIGDDSRSVVLTIELTGFSDADILSLQTRIVSFVSSQQTYENVMKRGCALLREICKRYAGKSIKFRRVSFRLQNVRTFIENLDIQAADDEGDDTTWSAVQDDYSAFWYHYEQGLMKDSNTLSYKLRIAETMNAPSPGVVID